MLVDIEHRLLFRYDAYISESVMELRVEPQSGPHQTVRSFYLAVGPPTQVARHLDWNGNAVHHFGIAEQGLPKAGGAALQGAQRQRGDLIVKRAPKSDVDSKRHPLQHAAARLANNEIEHHRRQNADQQGIKRADAVTKDDSGIDLQYKYRHRQRQQIDEQRNQYCLAQAGARRLHHRFQPFAAGGLVAIERK